MNNQINSVNHKESVKLKNIESLMEMCRLNNKKQIGQLEQKLLHRNHYA
jgi:hypothetical protein